MQLVIAAGLQTHRYGWKHQTSHQHDAYIEELDAGEEDAIALAAELRADLILMDDRDGVRMARSKGFRVAGTRGILYAQSST